MQDQCTVTSSWKHRCSICNKGYSTNSHLRRHEGKHTGANLRWCPFCSRSFSRVDVARRHVKKCSTDGHAVVFPTATRGKKRRACDRCSKSKLSCDANVPCARCHTRQISCTYQRLTDHVTSSNTTEDHTNFKNVNTTNTPYRIDYGRIPIGFLVDFTDPSSHGTTTVVAADLLNQPNGTRELDPFSPLPYSDNHAYRPDIPLWDLAEHPINLCDRFAPDADEGCSFEQCDHLVQDEEAVALRPRMREIISQLCITHNAMSRNGVEVHGDFNTQLAESVFTPSNLKRFVWTYFHGFHTYLPIVHQPTFDIKMATLPLLIAVFLFGSQCCIPLDSAISARTFFDTAEEYIFSHATFRRLLQADQSMECSADDIEVLQGALIIEIVQNVKSDVTKRRRSRLERYPSLVAAVRCSGLFGARRPSATSYTKESDWPAFISAEMRVRIAVWTFMTDSVYAVFYNMAPLVNISEMIGDFPCEQDLFAAATAHEFERLASLIGVGQRSCSVSDLLSSTLQTSEAAVQSQIYSDISAGHLLVLICALQSIMMSSRTSSLAGATGELILGATDRWKVLWNAVTEREREASQQIGFVRHAPEFWWLTRTVIKVGRLGDPSCRYMQTVPTDSLHALHDFIDKYRHMV